MKRIATLFLVVTLFYNMIGYYVMFAYKEQQAWVARMENTSSSDFRVIRLNASLYSFRKVLIGVMFTSLNVVNMAVSFFAATRGIKTLPPRHQGTKSSIDFSGHLLVTS